jgi:3-oxoacyl-[acyl-carrier-protein] synthase-3
MAVRPEMCINRRGISPEEIDLIIVATVTPDMLFPSTACIVQEKLGAKNTWGFDILAACSGFIFTLTTGVQFIESGMHKKVLIIGADKMTSIVNYRDRNTCVLFGDAAGAVLLEPAENNDYGIMDTVMHIDGKGGKYLHMLGGGSLNPPSHHTIENNWHYNTRKAKRV